MRKRTFLQALLLIGAMTCCAHAAENDAHSQIARDRDDPDMADLREARDDEIDLARAGDAEQSDHLLEPPDRRPARAILLAIAAP